MIKFEKTEIVGWEAAIRCMHNPTNSWEKSDSGACINSPYYSSTNCIECTDCCIRGYKLGSNDLDLMKKLRNAGTDHRKFMQMIVVYVDITAPLYWWKEFDTHKVGIVVNSCSTMHKIADKKFEFDDFSHEHLLEDGIFSYPLGGGWRGLSPIDNLKSTIELLNNARNRYLTALKTEDATGISAKNIWWQMIQLLPSSYNQKRTVMMSYEVLANIYKACKNHEQDEWKEHIIQIGEALPAPGFCDWIRTLPYSELITGEETETIEIF